MYKIRMLCTSYGTRNGFSVEVFIKGHQYFVPGHLAKYLVQNCSAEYVS